MRRFRVVLIHGISSLVVIKVEHTTLHAGRRDVTKMCTPSSPRWGVKSTERIAAQGVHTRMHIPTPTLLTPCVIGEIVTTRHHKVDTTGIGLMCDSENVWPH